MSGPTRKRTLQYLVKEDVIFKQYVEVAFAGEKVVGFRAYNHYFTPSNERRRPVHDVPVFVSQAVLNKAREWAKQQLGIRPRLRLTSH